MMVHTFTALGQYLAADVNSGAVHVLDKLSYDLLSHIEGPMGEELPEAVAAQQPQYRREELAECWEELLELQKAGLLFTDDEYLDPEAAMALNGMPLVQMAVNNAVGEVGIHFITFAIFAFAFSSLIGNYFYAETNFRYIFKNTKWGMLIFRVLCLAAIFYGCVNSFDLAWNLADIFMGFMAIINLVAILLLGKWALAALDDYTRQRKEGKDPVFIAASVPGMPACECWTTADLPNFGDNPVEEYIEEAASLDSEGLR